MRWSWENIGQQGPDSFFLHSHAANVILLWLEFDLNPSVTFKQWDLRQLEWLFKDNQLLRNTVKRDKKYLGPFKGLASTQAFESFFLISNKDVFW